MISTGLRRSSGESNSNWLPRVRTAAVLAIVQMLLKRMIKFHRMPQRILVALARSIRQRHKLQMIRHRGICSYCAVCHSDQSSKCSRRLPVEKMIQQEVITCVAAFK